MHRDRELDVWKRPVGQISGNVLPYERSGPIFRIREVALSVSSQLVQENKSGSYKEYDHFSEISHGSLRNQKLKT